MPMTLPAMMAPDAPEDVSQKRTDDLSMYVIYLIAGWPKRYVVRVYYVSRCEVRNGGFVGAANGVSVARKMIPGGYYCVPRDEDDEPQIIESWV